MPVDAKLFESLNRLIKKYPNNSKVDWFVMGYLFAHPNNIKSLDEVFNTVNNITQLAREDSLSIEESNDVLLRMMNNLSNSERSKGRNSQREQETSQSSEREYTKKTDEGNKKKLMFPIKMNGGNKRDLIEDDMSYKSESDTEQKRESQKKNSRTYDTLKEEDEEENSDEETFRKHFGFGTSKSNSQTISYVKKPVSQVDTSSLRDNRNLKRPPQEDEEQLSMELIRRLQEEDSRSQRLLEEKTKKEEKEAKETKETMDGICSICLGSLLDESFIPLEGCEHIFHENCFAEYLKSEIQSRHFPIKCPSNCGQEVSQSDMVQVLDKDIVAKFYEYSLQKYVTLHGDDMSCCPTPGCSYVFYQDEGEKTNELNCPLCKKKYCLDCKTEYHKGLSCKEYQMMKKMESSSNKFEKFSQGKKYKQCPKCKFWAEKLEGYDHLTCRCKNQFCFKCGGKYRNCECVKKMQEEIQKKQELARQKQQEMKNRKKRH